MNYVFIGTQKWFQLWAGCELGRKPHLTLFTPGHKTRPSIVIREQFANKLLGQVTKRIPRMLVNGHRKHIWGTWRVSGQNQFIAPNPTSDSRCFSSVSIYFNLSLALTRSYFCQCPISFAFLHKQQSKSFALLSFCISISVSLELPPWYLLHLLLQLPSFLLLVLYFAISASIGILTMTLPSFNCR